MARFLKTETIDIIKLEIAMKCVQNIFLAFQTEGNCILNADYLLAWG